jgi:hypothetical protein
MSKTTSGGWLYEARELICEWFGTKTALDAVEVLAKSKFKDSQIVEMVAYAMSLGFTGSEIIGVEERVAIMVSKEARDELRQYLKGERKGTGEGYSYFILEGIKALRKEGPEDN